MRTKPIQEDMKVNSNLLNVELQLQQSLLFKLITSPTHSLPFPLCVCVCVFPYLTTVVLSPVRPTQQRTQTFKLTC